MKETTIIIAIISGATILTILGFYYANWKNQNRLKKMRKHADAKRYGHILIDKQNEKAEDMFKAIQENING